MSDFCDPIDWALQTSLSFTISQSLLKLMYIESMVPSNHLILCHPLLLLTSVFLKTRVFSNELALFQWVGSFHQVAKVLELQLIHWSISPPNDYQGLISFRIEWFDFLAVQGTLKSLLQHHSSKASIVWCSVFFAVQLSHPYMTTGKTTALTIWTFVGKVMSLLFKSLSRFIRAFLPRNKCLLISCLQSP